MDPRSTDFGKQLISRAATGALASVKTRHLFTMHLQVQPIVRVGTTPNNVRRLGFVTGGTIVGERVNGRVLAGGNDWQLWRPDGSLSLDVRLAFETTGGVMVTMAYRGLRRGPSDVIAALERGEEVDPNSYYFRIASTFETAEGELDWLNGIMAIGIGHRFADGPVYNIFEVL
jgi:hypothetical protein